MKFSPIYARQDLDGYFVATATIDGKWDIGLRSNCKELAINAVKNGLCMIEQHFLTEDMYEESVGTLMGETDLSQGSKFLVQET